MYKSRAFEQRHEWHLISIFMVFIPAECHCNVQCCIDFNDFDESSRLHWEFSSFRLRKSIWIFLILKLLNIHVELLRGGIWRVQTAGILQTKF